MSIVRRRRRVLPRADFRPDVSVFALRRPQRSERDQFDILRRAAERRRPLRPVRVSDAVDGGQRAGDGRCHVRRHAGHRRARPGSALSRALLARRACGTAGGGGAQPQGGARLLRCHQEQVPGPEAVRGARPGRSDEPREGGLPRLSRRSRLADDRHQQDRHAEGTRRQ